MRDIQPWAANRTTTAKPNNPNIIRNTAAEYGDTGSSPAWMTRSQTAPMEAVNEATPGSGEKSERRLAQATGFYRMASPSVSENPTETPRRLTTSVAIVLCTSERRS